VVEGAASFLLAGVLLVWALPRVAGADWSAIRDVLGVLHPLQVAALTVVWLVGLWVQTIALAAAMPGLSHRRAFFLNLTGSAVSNVLPLGGAAGTALNYSTSRSWGFSTRAFLRWALVTNIWDTLGKLLIPGVALLWLAIDSMESPKSMVRAAVGALVLLAVLIALTWFVVRHELGARLVGRAMDALAPRLRRRGPQGPGYTARALEFRRDTAALVATAWPRLTVGKAGYAACQALLLWLCLTWLGGDVAPSVAFAAFAAERVLSLAVITPGATGVVEIGMVGMLVAFGTDPATAAAAVLLYRAFIIGMEIPTGGVLMFWWLLRHRDRRTHGSRGKP
jgi:uncharacterized membrane protein YbhN (UPF0104 family)